MNAFEELVAGLLRHEGYWTHPSYKVVLTKEEKREVGKPSLPRIEIDILAYKAPENALMWVECKSYLDSPGVQMGNFLDERGHYKIFADRRLRSIAQVRLVAQAVEQGLARPTPSVQYWLVAGHIAQGTVSDLEKLFADEDWTLRTDGWIRERLETMARGAYEDDVATMVAKVIRRVQG